MATSLRDKLGRLDESDLAELFQVTGLDHNQTMIGGLRPTRLHALTDGGTLLSKLQQINEPLRKPDRDEGALLAPKAFRSALEVHHAVDGMTQDVVTICGAAGLQDPAAVMACHRRIRRVALYMSGFSGHIHGKERQRLLTTIAGDAERLRATLPNLSRWALARAKSHRSRSILDRSDDITSKLEVLLPRLIENARRLLDELHLDPPGRAEIPDPVRFGAEGILAIWLRHHPTLPTLSRNRQGFLVFGEMLLKLSVEALGEKPHWIQKTTLETALRNQVQHHRIRTNN